MIIEKIKYKLLINIFNKKKKLLWTLMNNLFHNLLSAPTISVLNLSTNTTLGKKNEKIFVTNDSYQTWYIMNDQNFHQGFVDKIKEFSKPEIKYKCNACNDQGFYYLCHGACDSELMDADMLPDGKFIKPCRACKK